MQCSSAHHVPVQHESKVRLLHHKDKYAFMESQKILDVKIVYIFFICVVFCLSMFFYFYTFFMVFTYPSIFTSKTIQLFQYYTSKDRLTD